uniref:Peptidase S1 domain-containing protein n=1 Tax=Chelonoidis abingdonii TaxID=106734 RepID=A0A8C0JCT8_CHEAB
MGVRTPGFYSLCSPLFSSACEQPKGSPRIVGGNDAKNGSWPWQVSIREGSNHICGGSLIAESWVVSAAHSIPVWDKSAYLVNLGEYQLLNPSESLVSFPIKEIYRHPSYTDIGFSGDIALVELETPVKFNSVIRPICLPASSVEFPSGMECWVTGWGDTQYGAPKTLQEVQVPLIDRDTCNSLFNTGSYPDDPQGINPIKQDMICAGYPQGEKDACQGDSGGPLVCEWDSAWLLAGVVSWGVECARPNRPGVYILLPPYADWIQAEPEGNPLHFKSFYYPVKLLSILILQVTGLIFSIQKTKRLVCAHIANQFLGILFSSLPRKGGVEAWGDILAGGGG